MDEEFPGQLLRLSCDCFESKSACRRLAQATAGATAPAMNWEPAQTVLRNVTECCHGCCRTLATNTVSMSGTMSCSAPVVSMTITVVVSVMRVAPPMNAAAPTCGAPASGAVLQHTFCHTQRVVSVCAGHVRCAAGGRRTAGH